jgi:hypothetical protein
MGRIAYVNGRFVPHGEAMVHIEDRGYQQFLKVFTVYPSVYYSPILTPRLTVAWRFLCRRLPGLE